MFRHIQAIRWMRRYLRYVDYIAAAQLYLQDNFLVREPLKPDHIKPRILGHWGTVPGLNLIYANLNYLAHHYAAEILLVTGPGHGAPAILANLYAEETLNAFYKKFPLNASGMGKLIHDFSWPHTLFPSHVTPTVPGSILEGGELGYSLSTAYGAALDNPDLIVAAVVGDGEAETGPIATAWHSNKFLNPKTSGAVLPILHLNGYKISNPTIYGTMSNEELTSLFEGYGYFPFIVEGGSLEGKMLRAVERSYQMIRIIQQKARVSAKPYLKPRWPVILLRSPKGWKGIHQFRGHLVEGSFHSHGIPLGHPREDQAELKAIERWLRSYKIHQLVNAKGEPHPSVMRYIPLKKQRLGMNKHAIGGALRKELKIPPLSRYEIKFKEHGHTDSSSMINAGPLLRDIFKANKTNFRVMCPDELESNLLSSIFEATPRAYLWPTQPTDEHIHPEGRAMEMLSEHTLQGWLQGYLLTGRHGLFVSYEAFTPIISSMVDQYAKFLKQSMHVPWRKPISSAIYLLTSVGWRQDHNGYSHQNPSFVSNMLQKHGNFCQIYYPVDANSVLAAFEETFKRKNSIAVIVAGKTPLPQWLSLKEAREQAKRGLGIWEWVGGPLANQNPDVVLASAGDYVTQEALLAVRLCQELVPSLKIRYVNVSELTSVGLGDRYTSKDSPFASTESELQYFFTPDKPVVFNYHGYVNDLEQILWSYTTSSRFSLHGYREEGSTTTPFDIKIANGVSCYHLAMDLITQAAKRNKSLQSKKPALLRKLNQRIADHQAYITRYGDDPPSIKAFKW